MKILVINPGSTSTKFAVYEKGQSVFEETLRHSSEDLKPFQKIADQYKYRRELIKETLIHNGHLLDGFDGVIGRGGLLKPVAGGIYPVNAAMLDDLKTGRFGEHASNLGAGLAHDLASYSRCPSFIADPVVVDELEEIATISGIPEIKRVSLFHALNQKAVAKLAAKSLGKSYQECNFVVAHLGGGISVGAHQKGRVIDVNNAINGDGAFSPERSGGVPIGGLVEICFSGDYTREEINRKINGKGGLVAYLETTSAIDIRRRVLAGDQKAELIYQAMAYQVSKDIGAMASVLKGKINAIIITGGIAYDDELMVPWIRERTAFIADILVYPGEQELEALHQICFDALNGKEKLKEYL